MKRRNTFAFAALILHDVSCGVAKNFPQEFPLLRDRSEEFEEARNGDHRFMPIHFHASLIRSRAFRSLNAFRDRVFTVGARAFTLHAQINGPIVLIALFRGRDGFNRDRRVLRRLARNHRSFRFLRAIPRRNETARAVSRTRTDAKCNKCMRNNEEGRSSSCTLSKYGDCIWKWFSAST